MDDVIEPRRWMRVCVYAVLIGFAVVYLAPLFVVVLNSLRSNADIGRYGVIGLPHSLEIDNFSTAWAHYCISQQCSGIRPFVVNSLAITIPATLLSAILGALCGYSISLWRFRGDQLAFAFITLGVFLPEQMKLVPWIFVLRWFGLSDTLLGLIFVHVVQGISFSTLFCRNYYVNVPHQLVQAARIDGAGFYRLFWRIILPLSPPILIVTVIWQFTGIWNEYLYGVVLTHGGSQPVTAALIALSGGTSEAPQYGVQSAAVLIAAAPPLLIYFCGGKYFMRGLTAGAVK
jgi:glucose/mannose transport system permease protein